MGTRPGAANTTGVLRLLIAFALLLASGCATQSRGVNGDLLHGRAPRRAVLVNGAGKLTDGIVDVRGDDWRAQAAAVLGSPQAYVEYDLGRTENIGAAYLQADANDFYTLSVSDDGVHFNPLWRAEPAPRPGFQSRWAENLHGRGRYLRLSVSGGDGRYSAARLPCTRRAAGVPAALYRAAARRRRSCCGARRSYWAFAGAVSGAGVRRRPLVVDDASRALCRSSPVCAGLRRSRRRGPSAA